MASGSVAIMNEKSAPSVTPTPADVDRKDLPRGGRPPLFRPRDHGPALWVRLGVGEVLVCQLGELEGTVRFRGPDNVVGGVAENLGVPGLLVGLLLRGPRRQ